MLVLSRRESERIRLGDSIVVTVVKVAGDRVRLGIEAPSDVLVLRDELERRGGRPAVAARTRHSGRIAVVADVTETTPWQRPRAGCLQQCEETSVPRHICAGGNASSIGIANAVRSRARTDRAGQTAVVRPVLGVPQRLSLQHPLSQNIDFRTRTGGCIGRGEVVCLFGREILVVSTLQNCLKHVSHHKLLPRKTNSLPQPPPNDIRRSRRHRWGGLPNRRGTAGVGRGRNIRT